MHDTLTGEELRRYSRQVALKGFGVEKQLRLKRASVLVVGAGGLGCPALLYLVAAGVGRIGIIDSDVVDVSNLQRQVLYSVDDIGRNKAVAAAKCLTRLNPLTRLDVFPERLTTEGALALIKDYDVVIDGTDNLPTRYLINDACVLLGKPFVYASILAFEGQVAVFNFQGGPTYRDLFPEPPPPDMLPNCAEAGVLGVLPGIIGTLQASEVIKIVSGAGEPLSGKLLVIDVSTMEQSVITLKDKGARNRINSLADYDDFCGINAGKNKSLTVNQPFMKEVTAQELKEMMDQGADFQLIDVREPHEFDICNLNGELIPMSEIPDNVDKISRDKKVVLHCRSGKRSGDMLLWLEKNHGFTNLYNLKGGVLAWAKEVDPEFPTY